MRAKKTRTRQELLQRVGMDLGRELSAQTVFFHEAAARRLGLNATDTRCLDLIVRSAQAEITAGDLGRATGLTTGAVTGILDRLEKAGMVERVRDASDRRKVLVRPRAEGARRMGALYDGLGAAMMKIASSYDTGQLELIDEFLERNLTAMTEQIARLQ